MSQGLIRDLFGYVYIARLFEVDKKNAYHHSSLLKLWLSSSWVGNLVGQLVTTFDIF